MEENPTSKNMSSPEETSEPGRKFKASELTFNLPEELHKYILPFLYLLKNNVRGLLPDNQVLH